MLDEMESQIDAGWLNRDDAAIERFGLCIEMTRGDTEWTVNATMLPVLPVLQQTRSRCRKSESKFVPNAFRRRL